MKHFNDVDEIYKFGLYCPINSSSFTCTVCEKIYVNEKAAWEHFNKRNCHSYVNVFKDTITEELIKKMYDVVRGINSRRARALTVTQFRSKKRVYNSISKFYLFCFNNKLVDYFDYLEFLILKTRWKYPLDVFSHGRKQSTLIAYMRDRAVTRSDNESEKFFETHTHDLKRKTIFTIRALERGDITYDYLFSKINFEVFVSKLSVPLKYRLEKFLVMIASSEES